MEFTLTHPDSGLASIVVLFDGVPYEANSNHPWWEEIVDLVLEDDPRVLDLFPIRSIQQPSTLIDEEPIPNDNAAIADVTEYTSEALARVRAIFDRAGYGICEDPDCPLCYGPRFREILA